MISSQLLTTEEAANLLNVSRRSLEKWRLTGNGPVFIRMGGGQTGRSGLVRYRAQDLEDWIASQARRSTSDPGQEAA